jgi:hypothetical protein
MVAVTDSTLGVSLKASITLAGRGTPVPCLDPFGFIAPCGELMIFLQSYFDESGKCASHDDNIISFCGFVSSVDKWRACWDEWDRLLFNYELPEIKAHHVLRYRRAMTQKMPAIGIDARVEALKPFVDAIRQSIGFGVAVTLDCIAYRNLSEADRNVLGEPHYWAFRQAFLLIKQWAEHRYVKFMPDVQVSMCCDQEERYSVECLKLFIKLRKEQPEMRKRFVSIAFGDDKAFFQLQAADLLASLARQESAQRFHSAAFDMKPLYDLMFTDDSQLTPIASKFMDGTLLSGAARAAREERKTKKPAARKG